MSEAFFHIFCFAYLYIFLNKVYDWNKMNVTNNVAVKSLRKGLGPNHHLSMLSRDAI